MGSGRVLNIRIHEIGNTWLADEYRNGEYVRNIMKHSYRSALIENLSKAGRKPSSRRNK